MIIVTIIQLKHLLSKIRQQRYYLEKQIEQTGKMLSACMILRYRARGTRDFQSLKESGKLQDGKSYTYLTYLEKGVTIHKYIRKNEIDNVSKLTDSYRTFCEKIAQVRLLNKRIVELLDEVGKIQTEEVKDYVQPGTKRIGKKKRAK